MKRIEITPYIEYWNPYKGGSQGYLSTIWNIGNRSLNSVYLRYAAGSWNPDRYFDGDTKCKFYLEARFFYGTLICQVIEIGNFKTIHKIHKKILKKWHPIYSDVKRREIEIKSTYYDDVITEAIIARVKDVPYRIIE